MLSSAFVESIVASVIGAFLWFLIDKLFQQVWKIEYLSQIATFRISPIRKYVFVFLWSFAISIVLYVLKWPLVAIVFLTLGVLIYPLRWLFHASSVGLYQIDRAVAKGIDYKRALRLAKNSIDFLGTGAFKLTSEQEFEDAIRRCNRSDRPIRFLLSDPENPALTSAAAQAGEAPTTYRYRVEQSLKILANLKISRHMNIEVRLYRNSAAGTPETFRLMFIDDAVCLMSYNVYGRGDARDIPQLMFRNTHDKDDTKVFYTCFRSHFERQWKSGEPWKPESHL